jgi:hypothetical protein
LVPPKHSTSTPARQVTSAGADAKTGDGVGKAGAVHMHAQPSSRAVVGDGAQFVGR